MSWISIYIKLTVLSLIRNQKHFTTNCAEIKAQISSDQLKLYENKI